jgi:hypothetical protein
MVGDRPSSSPTIDIVDISKVIFFRNRRWVAANRRQEQFRVSVGYPKGDPVIPISLQPEQGVPSHVVIAGVVLIVGPASVGLLLS